MRSKNSKNLDAFIMRETINCFIQKTFDNSEFMAPMTSLQLAQQQEPSSFIDPSTLLSSLLGSIMSHRLTPLLTAAAHAQGLETSSKPQQQLLSYPLVFLVLDSLEILGLISRKSDAQCNQRFMRWNGIRDGFGNKFNWCFSKSLVG